MGLHQQHYGWIVIKSWTLPFDVWLLTALIFTSLSPICSTCRQNCKKVQIFLSLAFVEVSNHASPCQHAGSTSLNHKNPNTALFPAPCNQFWTSLGEPNCSPQKASLPSVCDISLNVTKTNFYWRSVLILQNGCTTCRYG